MEKRKEKSDFWWGVLLWIILWITICWCIYKYIELPHLERHYVGEKVEVLTEQWLQEYRVHSEEKDMYNTMYRLSNDEYGVYESCVRWADWLYIPCPNWILVSQEELETMFN